jgi:hypothetical protein
MSSEPTAALTEKQQYWLAHIQQAKRDNLSFSAYAQQQGLDLKALYNAHWALRKKGYLELSVPTTDFVKVRRPTTSVPDTVLNVTLPNGIRIEIPVRGDDLLGLLQQVSAL